MLLLILVCHCLLQTPASPHAAEWFGFSSTGHLFPIDTPHFPPPAPLLAQLYPASHLILQMLISGEKDNPRQSCPRTCELRKLGLIIEQNN